MRRISSGIREFILSWVVLALVACGGGSDSHPTPAKTLQSIAITPNPAQVAISTSTNFTLQLTATGTYSDGSTANITGTAAWASSATTIATVGAATGVATAVAAGSSNITATVGSISGTVALAVVTDTWVSTGNMVDARANHTATVLSNGNVLVAGGTGSGATPIAEAEIYDSAAGTWAATASLNAERSYHTATLLSNGNVLVVGGLGAGASAGTTAPLASAEIYNPTAGTWTLTGSLNTARWAHTATLLADGTVLVAGGSTTSNTATSGSVGTTSAEIYDPTSGTWTATGSLITARIGHTASILSNGMVLVAGGLDSTGDNGLASAELFDPTAGTWSATGSMTTGRSSFSATVLANGQVLAAGGYNVSTGFQAYMTQLSSAELYDPTSGTWTATGSMPAQMVYQTATLLSDGTVFLAGGGYSLSDELVILATAYIYDPTAGTWTAAQSLPAGRLFGTASLLSNGTVLFAGGGLDDPGNTADSNQPTNTALLYY